MVLLMSLEADPENLLFEIWPPYETKLEVLGENAIQLRHILSIKVFLPIVTLIVSVVPWRLVGAAETWRAPLLLSRLNPFKNTLITGCCLVLKGRMRLAFTTAQFWHLLLVWRLAELVMIYQHRQSRLGSLGCYSPRSWLWQMPKLDEYTRREAGLRW